MHTIKKMKLLKKLGSSSTENQSLTSTPSILLESILKEVSAGKAEFFAYARWSKAWG